MNDQSDIINEYQGSRYKVALLASQICCAYAEVVAVD